MSSSSSSKVYLITGSNIGLGYDAARQLAMKPTTKKVYLACRTKSKALKAIDDLVEKYDIPASKLAFVPFNASADKLTIAKEIIQALPRNETLHGIILNAGGIGSDAEAKAMGPNHVTQQMQINLIGHIHLVDALQQHNFLRAHETTIVFSGSEGARGVPVMGMAAPKIPQTTDQVKKLIDGSGAKKMAPMDYYCYVKGVGTLYWSEWARRNPEYYILTVSPGATSGTNIGSHEGMGKINQVLFPLLFKMMGPLGVTHRLEKGAKRYVEAVNREGQFEAFPTGAFVASAHGVSGPVSDQGMRKEKRAAQYGDVSTQEAVFEAVQAFAVTV